MVFCIIPYVMLIIENIFRISLWREIDREAHKFYMEWEVVKI